MTTVTTTYLEMLSRDDLRPCSRPCEEMRVVRAEVPCGELNRFFYTAVGDNYGWTDRLPWTGEEWQAYAERPELETLVDYVRGTAAGYFELARGPGSDIEIAYFGLLPQFIGKGLGGALLHSAIDRAWRISSTRVWVHTCTLDSPFALANYLARGMYVYKTEIGP